ncbi:DNA-binding domain-containing protein [Marinobacterium sediminicola]|uniref:DNA-binding domain-containing protein n=1 Tax=Marinobacterium sediminicola TaxID=518898 RepID=A0ABY1S1A6_9GAMM|nr:putative DNA-binding domain-containing protein [Marinobacterium sediminicola]ULG69757.1 putative DNA-binding domain-containing protein [Marinobacterium sediminicola]SMR75433.1 hypothetical protein SAMN04487964_10999 [Marinobacterium sediminicola]
MNVSRPEPDFIRCQRRFAEQIRNPELSLPEGIEARRMQVYVELFFNNIAGFLEGAFPVYRSLCDDPFWQAEIRRFMQEYGSKSPLFRDLALAYRDYVENTRRPQPEDPPFLQELLHYEWVELALDIAEEDPFMDWPPATINPDQLLREHPVVSPLAWSFGYQWPVHRINSSFCPDQPAEQPSWLLVYRNREDKVKFIELNALSARLLWLLNETPDLSGARALELIADELPQIPRETIIQGGLDLMQQFMRDDILLGTHPAGNPTPAGR